MSLQMNRRTLNESSMWMIRQDKDTSKDLQGVTAAQKRKAINKYFKTKGTSSFPTHTASLN